MTLFDQEFFPTPRKLIEEMVRPYLNEKGRLDDMTVLEPSAGKGDIAEYIQNRMHGQYYHGGRDTDGIYCIERSPDLQAILREKGYTVLGDDFLQYDGSGLLIDLIVMNPPFSNGAAHLIHAFEIMRSGHIVCILPSETIRNVFTKERQWLMNIIDDHGEVEHIGQAFKTAERKTGVEVCIVRLHKDDETEEESIFESTNFTRTNPFAGDEDAPILNENQIASRDVIARMVDAYRATLGSFAGAVKAMREMQYYGAEFGDRFETRNDNRQTVNRDIVEAFHEVVKGGFPGVMDKAAFTKTYRSAFNQFADKLRKAAWDTVFAQTDATRFMTQGVRDEFAKLQQGQSQVDFSESNILGMIETLMMSGGHIREAAIIEAFDYMTKYHDENRVYVEGWKTNDSWKVNRRFILPYVVDFSWSTPHISYNRRSNLEDIDRAICLLEGEPFDKVDTICETIERAIKDGVPSGEKIHSQWFEIKYYKKGTGHFYFKDEGVWARFNVAACKGKNWLPEAA